MKPSIAEGKVKRKIDDLYNTQCFCGWQVHCLIYFALLGGLNHSHLRKITCEPMQPPYYIEAIPLICEGWGMLLFVLLFCIRETCYSKRLHIYLYHALKRLFSLCLDIWYIFSHFLALVIKTFFPFWAKIFLLTADFKCILCNSINWFSLEKDFQSLKLSFFLMS